MIFIIVGHTGAGKTCVAKEISERHDLPVVSFSHCGKSIAQKKGLRRIRDCWNVMDKEDFSAEMASAIFLDLNKKSKISNTIIIEGLYSEKVLNVLKKTYSNVIIVYISVSEKVRLERISNRINQSHTLINKDNDLIAYKENEIKETIKNYLGLQRIIEQADFVINGEDDLIEVIRHTDSIFTIEEKLFLANNNVDLAIC